MADTDRWDQAEDEEGADLAPWLCPTCKVFISGKINALRAARVQLPQLRGGRHQIS